MVLPLLVERADESQRNNGFLSDIRPGLRKENFKIENYFAW